MPSYRQVIITTPQAPAKAMKEVLVNCAKAALSRGGVVRKFENKGLQVLQYPFTDWKAPVAQRPKHDMARFIWGHYDVCPAALKEVEDTLRSSQHVLRFMTFRMRNKERKVDTTPLQEHLERRRKNKLRKELSRTTMSEEKIEELVNKPPEKPFDPYREMDKDFEENPNNYEDFSDLLLEAELKELHRWRGATNLEWITEIPMKRLHAENLSESMKRAKEELMKLPGMKEIWELEEKEKRNREMRDKLRYKIMSAPEYGEEETEDDHEAIFYQLIKEDNAKNKKPSSSTVDLLKGLKGDDDKTRGPRC